MSDKKVIINTTGSLNTLLTVLFVALKLTKQIDWSWWWVLSPVWISFVILIIFLILITIVFLISPKKRRF